VIVSPSGSSQLQAYPDGIKPAGSRGSLSEACFYGLSLSQLAQGLEAPGGLVHLWAEQAAALEALAAGPLPAWLSGWPAVRASIAVNPETSTGIERRGVASDRTAWAPGVRC